MNKVLIVGCGDIGTRVGEQWIARGVPVTGVVRSDASAERLHGTGIFVLKADFDSEVPQLPIADFLVYYFVPPPVDANIDERMRKFVSILNANHGPARIVLISTTGVYGDAGGQWITENSAVSPKSDRGKRRLDAELTLRDWNANAAVSLVIFRVGGIYGTGRLPIRFLKSGQPLPPVHNSAYSNHIHADDLANICVAAARPNFNPGIYNATDGKPMRMVDYFNQVAAFLSMERPPSLEFGAAMEQLSPVMQSYLSESRRISNRKLLLELGGSLKYPSVEEGLPSCVTPDLVSNTANDSSQATRETV